MPEQIWWYVSRASGIVTLAASGLAVIWGLLLSTRVIRHRSLPKWLLDLHRFLGGIAVSFLGLHLGALVADNFVHFGLADLTIPGHSSWKTGAVAWGIVSMYLLVAVQATSLVRKRIPRRLWRWTHFASFPMFAVSLTHAATAGTDRSNRVYVIMAFTLAVVVVFLSIVRVIAARTSVTPKISVGRPAAPARRTTPVDPLIR